jgi:hypothetical protein
MIRKISIVVAVMFAGTIGLEMGGRALTHGEYGIVSSAQAIVGRPLTPVSVAGVARRTVRRCAVGVYYC